MGPLDKYILADDSLTATREGIRLKFFSPWYRTLPLSSLGKLSLTVNGREIALAEGRLEYEGRTYQAIDLPNQFTTWWFVLDPLTLQIPAEKLKLEKGGHYEIELELGLHIPYVLTGKEGKPLFAATRVTKNLICN